jgi:TP901 family phage tail tape measure protein
MPIQIPVTQTGFEQSLQAAAKKAGSNLSINLGTNAKSINALSQPLGRITGQADEFTKSMEAANARVLAFGASVGVLNSVVQGFKSLITTTIEVEKSLADINSVLQNSSTELNKFKKDIFDVARETGNSFKAVSEAALELSRQGLPANEVIIRLKDSMVLARLSGLDAAQAVEGLTAAVNSFSKEGLTTSQVLNKVSNAAALYAVSERDLIEAFKRSASVAQQAGVSIDELGGIITAVQQKTARGGAVIGNSFKTIFTRIQRPESIDLLQSIGVEVVDLEGKLLPATKLIEGLASKINSLGDIESANITEKIGGGFQIAPLLAALDDYSSKASVARGATEAFLNAGTEAYQRNTALNLTLAASINTASLNLKELANTLGEIGVTQNLNNILSFFNNFVSEVQSILEGEGLGSDLANGIIKGIGGVLSGPGLAIFGGIILKLTSDLIKFGTESLKTFFNIGNAAKDIKSLQGSIASTLLNNKNIQEQILKLEGNRVAQAKFFTTALNEQYGIMQKMQGIAASIAPSVYAGTVATKGAKGKNAAGGYMPAVSQETRDINRGVGGARSGDKPVIIPNFAFGGGKKGMMVAHTGEYIVPNFARGGSAIFNRDMIASMGLPSGAQKIGAAGGFIPNFAKAVGPSELIQSVGATSIKDLEKYRIPGTKSFDINGNILPESQAKQKLVSLGSVYNANLDPKTIMLIPSVSKYNSSGLRTIFKGSRKFGNKLYNSFEGGYSGVDPELKSGGLKSNSKFIKLSGIDSAMNNALASAANNILKSVQPDIKTQPATLTAESIGKYLEAGGAGALGSIRGALFESVINLITKGAKDKNQGTLDVSFDAGNNRTALEEIFGVEGQNVKYADFKNSIGQKDKFIDQVMKNFPRASKGFIPNFADPLKEAIGREMSAGVPASQIYVDQNSSLKNPMNPMGLMVANRRDEPVGGIQGISRARKEGANPMLYGASRGFVPNYAEPAFSGVNELGTKSKAIAANLENLNKKIAELNNSISKNKITYDQAQTELAQFIQAIDKTSTKTQQTVFNAASSKINKATDLEKPKKDFLGTVVGLQIALSGLSSAFGDAESTFGVLTKRFSEGASNVTTALLAFSALKGLAPETGKVSAALGKLGVYGAVAVGAFEAFKFASSYIKDWTGVTAQANKSTAMFKDAVDAAGTSLSSLSLLEQTQRKSTAKDLIYNIQGKQTGKVGSAEMQSQFAEFQLLSGISGSGEEAQRKITDILLEYGGANKVPQYASVGMPGGAGTMIPMGESIVINESKVGEALAGYLKTEEAQKNIVELNKKAAAEKEKEASKTEDLKNIELTRLSVAKNQLKNAMDISVQQQRSLDPLDRQLIIAEALNNLNEEQKRQLDYEITLRDRNRESADQIRSILNEQIDAVKGVVTDEEKRKKIQESLLSLTDQTILKDGEAKKVIEEIQKVLGGNLELNKESLSQTTEAINKITTLLNLDLKRLETQKQITDSVYDQKDAIEAAIIASKTTASRIDFSKTYAAETERLNLELRNAQLEASKGGNEEANRNIDIQIQRNKTRQVELDNIKNQVSSLAQAKSVAESVVPQNLVTGGQFKAVIQEARDYTKLQERIGEMLMAPGISPQEKANLEGASQEIEQLQLNSELAALSAKNLAEQEEVLAQKLPTVTSALDQFQNSLKQIPQKIQDLELERMTTTSGRRLAEISYEQETLRMQQEDPSSAAQIARDRSVKGVGQKFTEAFSETNYDRANRFGDALVSSAEKFRDTMIDGLVESIRNGEDLADVLSNAAEDFLAELTKTNLKNLFSSATSGITSIFGGSRYASGGLISGGSGKKDDVPALLMGGEFVMNKKAVAKYGTSFMSQLNSGTLKKFASGGSVDDKNDGKSYIIRGGGLGSTVKNSYDTASSIPTQTGSGGFYMPGYQGAGKISGKADLLAFTTQAYTSGKNDRIYGGQDYAGISLEAESVRLTNFGRRTGPMAEAIAESKGQAFDLYQQQSEQERDAEEQYAAAKKSWRKTYQTALWTTAISAVGRSAAKGFQAGWGSVGKDAALGSKFSAGFKGIISGGNAGGQNVGGLGNLFSGNLKNAFTGSQSDINQAALGEALNSGALSVESDGSLKISDGFIKDPSTFVRGSGVDTIMDLKDIDNMPFNDSTPIEDGYYSNQPVRLGKYATGGSVPNKAGVDTVPTMLSGGEFVLNSSAAKNIGTSQLQSLNSGNNSIVTEEKSTELNNNVLNKLDELIEATKSSSGSITVNVDSTGKTTEERTNNSSDADKNLSNKIRAAVISVIQQEKRLGGTLRR